MKASDNEKEAAMLGTPKLHELVRQLGGNGADIVMLMLKSMLADFLGFVGADWSNEQIAGLLGLIKDNYGHLTMAQWKLFFVKAKSGQFAQEGQRDSQTMIARITPMILTQWLLNYAAKCEEANEEYYAYTQKNRPEIEDANVEYVSIDRIKEALGVLADEWEKNIREGKYRESEEMKKKKIEAQEKMLRAYCQENNLDYETLESQYIVRPLSSQDAKEDKPF